MRFDNIHHTQQQVRGGHFGTRNNVYIEQNNYIMQGPKPPKMNFWQGLLTGLTGGSIFGGFGMPGMFGGCGMPGMFGGCGMGGSIFGGFGMGGFSPFGMGSFGLLGGTQGTAIQSSAQQSDAKNLAGLQSIYSDYKIEQTGDGKYSVRDKYGDKEVILSNVSLEEIADELASRNTKDGAGKRAVDIKTKAMQDENIVEYNGKYYKKDDTEHKTEYEYKDNTFKKKDATEPAPTTTAKPEETET